MVNILTIKKVNCDRNFEKSHMLISLIPYKLRGSVFELLIGKFKIPELSSAYSNVARKNSTKQRQLPHVADQVRTDRSHRHYRKN